MREEEINKIRLDFKIDKPLIFFDLETTGLDFEKDRIVEISAIKFFPDIDENIKIHYLVNPNGVKISPEALELFSGRITDEKLENEPTFLELSKEIFNFFVGCDICGYNIRYFDIPFLVEEFVRAGINDFKPEKNDTKVIDAYNILVKKEPRKLENTYEFYTNKKFEDAHNASSDNIALIEILNKQYEKYYKEDFGEKFIEQSSQDCKTDSKGNIIIDFSGMFLRNKDGDIIFGKGKHNGEKLSQENIGYVNWIITTSNFNNSTKGVAKIIKDWFYKKNTKQQIGE